MFKNHGQHYSPVLGGEMGDIVDDKLISKKVEAKLKYGKVIMEGRHHKHKAFSGKY